MFGPLLLLKITGTICPCLEKDEDNVARESCTSLESLPIRWYIKSHKTAGQSAGAMVGGLVSGLFGKGNKSSGVAGSEYIRINATFHLLDSAMGPSIVVRPSESQELSQEDIGIMPAEKSIPLKRFGKIEHVDDSSFLGMGGGCRSTVVCYWKNSEEEILRFDVMCPGSNTKNAEADADTRDDVIGKIMGLIEWDKNRRCASGELEEDDESSSPEEDDFENENDVCQNVTTPTKSDKPRGKAANMAHFAKREIEMQKRKRDREKKKNAYLKDSGGLKYTALAMANRS
uniref:Uncharacterized protein n=1 Tax=Ditylum brightwellii TaxID=49249 RepID=A0A7S4QQT8_9STRA